MAFFFQLLNWNFSLLLSSNTYMDNLVFVLRLSLCSQVEKYAVVEKSVKLEESQPTVWPAEVTLPGVTLFIFPLLQIH